MITKTIFFISAYSLSLFFTTSHARIVNRAPQMGWNSWNAFKLKINSTILKETADYLVSTGLRDAGYNYLIIDDGWQDKTRDPVTGRQRPNSTLFPEGIAEFAKYVHGKGLKVGIYSDAGIYTCGFQPGSWGYEELDAATYAEWGIDYLKYDNCGGFESGVHSPADRFGRMKYALLNSGRDIFYSLCEWGYQFPWYWADQISHSYRMSGDIKPLFIDTTSADCSCKTAYCLNTGYAGCSVLTIIRKMREIAPFITGSSSSSSPKAWADMDGLEIGHLTPPQERTQLSFWAALKSPLLISTDLSKILNTTLEILLNKDIISISQDKLGSAAQFVESLSVEKNRQIWSGEISGGRKVILVLNEKNETQIVQVPFVDDVVGKSTAKRYQVRDVWAGKTIERVSGGLNVTVEGHDTKVLILRER